MKKSLTINATRNGKKVSKSLGFVNPEVANSLVGGFAQMVNALTNDTFVNAEVVKKMDTNEQEQQSGGGNTGYDPTFRVFDTDDAITYQDDLMVQRGTTKSFILTGDGSFELVDIINNDVSSLACTGATLNGRVLSISPPVTTPTSYYKFQIKHTNSQGSSLCYVTVNNITVPVVPPN